METGEYVMAAVMAILAFATFFAVLTGPKRGVELARNLEDQRQKQQQRVGILASLLRTSQGTARLSPEHVGALNLIPLMFHGEKDVLGVYRRYMKYLHTFPLDQAKGQERFLDLLAALVATLGYPLDKTDLENFSYAPQGWANNVMDQYEINQLLVRLSRGQDSLRVSVISSTEDQPYSPPDPSA